MRNVISVSKGWSWLLHTLIYISQKAGKISDKTALFCIETSKFLKEIAILKNSILTKSDASLKNRKIIC